MSPALIVVITYLICIEMEFVSNWLLVKNSDSLEPGAILTSKILIYGIANGHRVNNSDCNGVINVKRAISGGSTSNLSGATYGLAHTYETNTTTSPIFWVDSQTGTAQRTYTVVFKVDAGGRETQIFRRNTSNFYMLAEILP